MIFACIALFAAFANGESLISQGANVAPNGDRLDVTSKCLRLNGRALVPIMGEMHYSRVPRDEWAKSLATMKEGGGAGKPGFALILAMSDSAARFYRVKVSSTSGL